MLRRNHGRVCEEREERVTARMAVDWAESPPRKSAPQAQAGGAAGVRSNQRLPASIWPAVGCGPATPGEVCALRSDEAPIRALPEIERISSSALNERASAGSEGAL